MSEAPEPSDTSEASEPSATSEAPVDPVDEGGPEHDSGPDTAEIPPVDAGTDGSDQEVKPETGPAESQTDVAQMEQREHENDPHDEPEQSDVAAEMTRNS
jgi:hypothetical protein